MKLGSTKADLEHLEVAAKFIIETCTDHSFLAFYGEMGSGKTTLIQAIAKELGSEDIISSPTFSLVNEYHIEGTAKNVIYHFDFYRIDNLEDVYDIGYEEYFYSDQFCFVEWPEKIESLLPENRIEIHISRIDGAENIREITIFSA